MTLSRTARILVALLLLAAAAFFWVNFFTQTQVIADDPATAPSSAATQTTPPTVTVPTDDGAGEAPLEAAAEADGPASLADAVDAAAPDGEGEATLDADADAETAAVADGHAEAEADAGTPAPSVTAAETAPPVVVVDAPVTLSRDVVVADLPFLITSPPVAVEADVDAAVEGDGDRRLASARATVNPFSPVVVRVAEAAAPEREVPTEAPVITEVAVPAEPGAIPGPRVTAPAPAVHAPAGTVVRELPRALPTGMPLSATPDLLRRPRAPVERVEVPTIAAVRLPEPESASPAEIAPPRVTASVASEAPEILGPGQPSANGTIAATSAPRPPLAAGTNVLSRYLRDNGYTFTGSALGPVSVGVFRSQDTPSPVVVAIGQTLPETDIVLTDLRGQQAELTLGDTSQILVLDLRR